MHAMLPLSWFFLVLSVFSGLALIVMVLLQQSSNSGIISNSTSHFAPGTLDVFKNKVTAVFAVVFISSIISLWVFEGKLLSGKKSVSAIEAAADALGENKGEEKK